MAELPRPTGKPREIRGRCGTRISEDHPEILAAIAGLWNRILEPAGLEFDYFAAKKPVQFSDNLEAFVTVKSSGHPLEYNALSSGIRICFSDWAISSRFTSAGTSNADSCCSTNPKTACFPDFLYDLIDIYLGIIRNTQFFVATHSPIIAAQFRPEERVILEFDEHYQVKRARRGVTPVGDDPNDVLDEGFRSRAASTAGRGWSSGNASWNCGGWSSERREPARNGS